MLYLKQSTASQSVLIGPFIDDTDGATAETGLTIANTDIRLSKNGGNLAAKNSGGGTHDEAGWYAITLDATDTDTVGRLQLHVKVSGALMVQAEYQVLEEAIYDALIGASAAGFDANGRVDVAGTPDVNVAQISGSATAADNLEASALGIVTGAVNDASATTTSFVADGFTEATDDHFNGRIIVFTSGALANQATDITDYTGGTQTLTFTALTEAPADNDTFVIV